MTPICIFFDIDEDDTYGSSSSGADSSSGSSSDGSSSASWSSSSTASSGYINYAQPLAYTRMYTSMHAHTAPAQSSGSSRSAPLLIFLYVCLIGTAPAAAVARTRQTQASLPRGVLFYFLIIIYYLFYLILSVSKNRFLFFI